MKKLLIIALLFISGAKPHGEAYINTSDEMHYPKAEVIITGLDEICNDLENIK